MVKRPSDEEIDPLLEEAMNERGPGRTLTEDEKRAFRNSEIGRALDFMRKRVKLERKKR